MLPVQQALAYLRSSITNKLHCIPTRQLTIKNKICSAQTSKAFSTSTRPILFNKSATINSGIPKRRSINGKSTPLAPKFNMEWPKITLFGDSITRRSKDADNGCWASHIAYKVGSYFDVDVRGFEGYNSKWALDLMPKLFPKSYLDKVEIFVLFFGHNDSWNSPPLKVPVDEYESNMRAIIKYLEENGVEKRKIILITPTWYHKEECDKYMKQINYPPIYKSMEFAEKYSEAVKRIAKDEDIAMVDFFEVSRQQEPLKDMFCDGCHFSREGAKLLFNCIMPVIEKKIEANIGKPLADLWHVTPLEQRDEVKEAMLKYKQKKERQQ